jgi:ribosomal-protein-alanine N-acetyltransferase
MNPAVRPATPPDLEPILAIAAASTEAPQWSPSAYAPYLTPDPQSSLLRTAFIAVSAEEILAFAAATLLLVPDSAGHQNLGQLDSLAVHPAARRHGLASALLRDLLAWACQNGARHFSLEVRASNAPALRLYRRLGFVQEDRRPRYYADPEEDALILGMPITSGLPNADFPP